MKFFLSSDYTSRIVFMIEETDDGFCWDACDDGVCLEEGQTAFTSERAAQQNAINWFRDYNQTKIAAYESNEDDERAERAFSRETSNRSL